MQAQLAELQGRLTAADLELQRLQDRCAGAEADAALQRSLAAAAKVEMTKLQQQLASRGELLDLEEKLRAAESGRAFVEKERLEEKQKVVHFQEKARGNHAHVTCLCPYEASLAESRLRELEAELKRSELRASGAFSRGLSEPFGAPSGPCGPGRCCWPAVRRSSKTWTASTPRCRRPSAPRPSWTVRRGGNWA